MQVKNILHKAKKDEKGESTRRRKWNYKINPGKLEREEKKRDEKTDLSQLREFDYGLVIK